MLFLHCKAQFPIGSGLLLHFLAIVVTSLCHHSLAYASSSSTFEHIARVLRDTPFHDNQVDGVTQRQDTRRKHNENSFHGFTSHELVVPIRLHHETGHPVSHGRHFRRRSKDPERGSNWTRRNADVQRTREHYFRNLHRRHRSEQSIVYDVIPDKYSDDSMDLIEKDERDYLEHSVANYSVKAFGESFLFHLTPFEDFLGPNYSLRFMGDPDKDETLHPDVPRHCFYSGYVNGKRDHRAILSVCQGLFGAFRTDKSDYLIQPEVPHPAHDDADEQGTKPHRIYRRSTRSAGDGGRQRCGFIDSTSEPSADIVDSPLGPDTQRGEQTRLRFDRRRQTRRKLSRLRARAAEVRSNASLSASVLHEFQVTSLVNSLQVFDVMRARAPSSSGVHLRRAKRKRRYLSHARHVEVMVTADNSMLRLHRDVEHYVLTLMAIVNHVYRDPSIENFINIVVVELVVIGDSQVQNGPHVVRNAHSCLKNFCQWQHEHNNPDDSHPTHHDTAVLITGQDICRTETSCDTLGLAELGTMCDSKRSCSINEDNGLSTAFTIAHEIGHEFSAHHDNSDKCQDSRGRTVSLNVMSPTLDNSAHPWTWSKCSAKYITNFLDNGGGRCLLDEPPRRVPYLPKEEPGEVFDANDQCSFVYGSGVTHCNFLFTNTCKRLWCVSQNASHGCRTPHVPWADGTSCGHRMWCQRGQCVAENRRRLPIDGGWGEWSRFGECSRTCGGGVKSAIRECDNPEPQHNGQYCTGRRKKHRPCNYQECPVESDIRAEQCAAFNDWSRHHRHRVRGISSNAQWIPKYDGIPEQDRCKLICQVRSRDQYSSPWYILKPKVINGTPCGPDRHDICVEGQCKPAGCDHILNSNTKEDNCAICNGNNTGCKLVEGGYNSGYNIGYNQVVVIPSGATNIVITQRSYSGDPNDNNYLALRDAHGSYILNGNRSVMKNKLRMRRRSGGRSRKYAYYCDYSGTAHVTERINCSKAIGLDIVVEVLSAGDLMPPNINYRYNIPVHDSLTYIWDPNGQWSVCSSLCEGKTVQKVLCVRSDGQVVSDRKCGRLPKPDARVRSCNTRCQITWHPRPSQCSVRCGPGTMNVEYECRKVTNAFTDDVTASNRLVEQVDEKWCSEPRPDPVAPCRGECLPTSWRYGEWSECSRSCGSGTQTRHAACYDSKGSQYPGDQCDEQVKVASRICSTEECPRWMTSRLSECSVTCGKGVERHRVWCGLPRSVRPDSECTRSSRPPNRVPCKYRTCPKWEYEEWGPCSVTCGKGVSSRRHRCVDDNSRAMSSSFCDSSSLQSTRPCSISRSCNVRWASRSAYDNSPSLVLRGLGRERPYPSPTTVTAAATEYSSATTSASTTSPPIARSHRNSDMYRDVSVVHSRLEKAQWRTGSWTQCTKSCDTGIRLRYVSCRHVISEKEMEEEACGSVTHKPPSREKCQVLSCPGKWRMGSWSKCSSTCGSGTRSRYVGCLYDGRYERHSNHCLANEKPAEREACRATVPCAASTTTVRRLDTLPPTRRSPSKSNRRHNHESHDLISRRTSTDGFSRKIFSARWRTGAWTGCSAACGNGTRKRVVECGGQSADPSASCDPSIRPASTEVCEGTDCPRWKHGRWEKCSRACGRGSRRRRVYCVTANGQATHDRKCDVTQRPDAMTSCNLRPCRRMYRWRKSAWTTCSASCGRGIKTRQVQCVDRRGRAVSVAMCVASRRSRPRKVRRCVVQRRCPRWRAGKWNRCSRSCGDGRQTRRVSCKYRTKVVLEALCDASKRPENERRCAAVRCATYEWNTSQWSACSRSCGEGFQKRSVACHSVEEQRPVDDVMCVGNAEKPSPRQPCHMGPCSASWMIGSWSECSRSCGSGVQRRQVKCVYIHPLNYTEMTTDSCDNRRRPSDVRDCDHGSCSSRHYWRVGSWSQCSATCGMGRSVRRVLCTDRVTQSRQPDDVCQAVPSFRPDRTRPCRATPCLPQSCLQLKTQQSVTTDGEYFLNVNNKMTRIYCHGMNSSQPMDYLTLSRGSSENYSEIFGFRLRDADSCPNNGTRDPHCACHRDHPDEGYTMFEKVRFDVTSMRVLGNDFTFAITRFGRSVAFGVAGDCYSRRNCPQGLFRINLEGTGFVVSDETRWRSYGIDSSMHVSRSTKSDVVRGNCGGYCSRCQPDPANGLLLRHRDG